MNWVLQALVYVLLLGLLTEGGNWFVRLVVRVSMPRQTKAEKAAAAEMSSDSSLASTNAKQTLRAGRTIGTLERLIIALAIVVGSWELVAGLVALKTIARYKELENQVNAEYFIVGTLASILWSVALVVAILAFDKTSGCDYSGKLLSVLGLSS